jgi:hypothetical protein
MNISLISNNSTLLCVVLAIVNVFYYNISNIYQIDEEEGTYNFARYKCFIKLIFFYIFLTWYRYYIIVSGFTQTIDLHVWKWKLNQDNSIDVATCKLYFYISIPSLVCNQLTHFNIINFHNLNIDSLLPYQWRRWWWKNYYYYR